MWFRISWAFLFVAYFAVLVVSKGAAAAYEKLWLWYAYEIAYKLDGSSQTYILRQLDPKNKLDKKYTTAINNGNRGSLPGGQMTWEEFLRSLSNLKGDPELPQLDETDFDKTASRIWNSKVKKTVMVNIAAANWDPKKVIDYHDYIDSLGAMIRKARAQLGDDAIKGELEKINFVNDRIVSIRSSEFRQDKYLGTDLRNNFPQVVIHTSPVSNPIKPSEIWDVVDLQATLSDPASETAIRAAVNMPQDTTGAWKKKFIDRVNEYGSTAFGTKKPFKNEPPFEVPAQTHRTVLAVWTNCLDATKRSICK
ncbi:hypothetical protein CMEL01_09983 [Colletotrichum melonis]|uniref:Uncharacterized protein n=1 Tax=Colletotrichum melonis TaxID=1209925 RepID=A0AAI9TW63_9PEZI|nr:hypothetical protein CMEL01_09983 [Colletotrichum melonis]